MLLLPQLVKIKWGSTKKYYIGKGYKFTKIGDEFLVYLLDLPKGSGIKVEYICDYCFKTREKPYRDLYRLQAKRIIKKDCCKDCLQLKAVEGLKQEFGVVNNFQREDVKEKSKQTVQEIYHVEYVAQSPLIQNKMKETSREIYGVDHPSQHPLVKEKTVNTNREKYGVDFYFQSDEFKEESKNTSNKKYGFDYPTQSPIIKNKTIKTNNDKYGFPYTLQVPEIQEKIKKTNLQNLGVENPLQSLVIQDKIAQTNIKKLGYANPFSSPVIQEKIAQTNLEKTGYDNPFKNPEVQSKIAETNIRNIGYANPFNSPVIQAQIRVTMYQNQSQMASKQQRYICNLIDGKLNYPFSRTSLDIAFPEDKIYVEYDGGGHWLNIERGKCTEEEFNLKERNRWHILHRASWREIRIISRKDRIPSDEVLIKIIDCAKSYLNSGHSWIHFDIDEGKVKCSQFEQDYDFGVLRLIKDKDIESSNKVVNI